MEESQCCTGLPADVTSGKKERGHRPPQRRLTIIARYLSLSSLETYQLIHREPVNLVSQDNMAGALGMKASGKAQIAALRRLGSRGLVASV